MFVFHSIPTTSDLYIYTENRFKYFLNGFKIYLESQTEIAGKSTKGKSGKASSYYRHLVRLIIGYEHQYNESISSLYDVTTRDKLIEFTTSTNFIQFNKYTNHFYSATIRSYRNYLEKMIIKEEEMDSQVNLESDNVNISENDKHIEPHPKKRSVKVVNNNMKNYPRSAFQVRLSKEINNWMCELDSQHQTFISLSNGKPYIEAHHLIPMYSQDDFINSIDFAENIVCLCPNCHRKIHYAKAEEKKEIIRKLYLPRESKYILYGIEISEQQLYRYYI